VNKPNNLLELDVRDSLDWDRALDDRRISVNAEDGRVTLTGWVPTYYDKVRAQHVASTVDGVRALDDKLLVGFGTAHDDAGTAEACRVALGHDRFVPAGSVVASVRRGRVELRGNLRNPFQRQSAEHAISRVDGVLRIQNLIAIRPGPIPADVTERINRAFVRSALVDAAGIDVHTRGHTIHLTGSVRWFAAMREAVETAAAAPGVDGVINDLQIEP
jgi:osmotically-inducible protein OsmY